MARFDLIFEGGGAKGIAFIGALQVLEQQHHTWRRLVGTSAGATTATLCAAGYTVSELMSATMEKLPDGSPVFSSFMDTPKLTDFTPETLNGSLTMEVLREIDIPYIPGTLEKRIDRALLDRMVSHPAYARVFSFVECGGLYAGEVFLNWLHEKLAVKGITARDTFRTFGQKTGSDLTVVASDTTDMEMLVLNDRTAPEVPIANAVRMSMSIPLVYQEVLWQPEWGTYMGRKKAGNVVVDGGLLSNFPIRLIAESDVETRSFMGEPEPGASPLGLMIDGNLPVPGASAAVPASTAVSHLRVVERISQLIDTMMEASDNEAVRRFAADICKLPAKGYGTLEFGMSGPRLEMFLEAARTAMTDYLKKVPGTQER